MYIHVHGVCVYICTCILYMYECAHAQTHTILHTDAETKKRLLLVLHIGTTAHQCSPQHTKGILAQYPFTMDFSLMWEWGGAKSFDVAAGSTQNMPFQYALPLAWGEHCSCVFASHIHAHVQCTCMYEGSINNSWVTNKVKANPTLLFFYC